MDSLLTGIKILDFTYLLPGPFATMMLSDLGAAVLRIESPTRIDMARFAPPFVDKENKLSCMNAYLDRNKKSITLDLKFKESLIIIERLILEKGFDIIIEQFRPGTMDRLGLSYEDLSAKIPGLIYCSITGYGKTGPLRDRAGHDINYLSLSGVMSYSGLKEKGPCLMGIQVADVGSGSNNAVIGILAAVINRMRTGKGQHIDVSMTDGMFPHHVVSGIRNLAGDLEPSYESEILNGGSLYGFYKTSDDKYISFGGLESQFLITFLKALGLDMYIERLMTPGIIDELKQRIVEIIKTHSRDYWIDIFKDIDACVEPVLTFSEAIHSEHVQARGLIIEVPGPDGLPVRQVAFPIRFSDYKPEYKKIGPTSGQDTLEILKSLNISDQDIETLRSRGVIGDL